MKTVCDHILGVWVKHPDLSLGTVLFKTSLKHVDNNGHIPGFEERYAPRKLYDIDDELLIKLLQEFDERTTTCKRD